MIHYFTTWGENNLGRKLSYSPAGLNKAKYVVGKLSTIDFVRVASFASGGLSYRNTRSDIVRPLVVGFYYSG